MRTLVLNLRLREGFEGGGNEFPQSPFLALDGGRGHGVVDRETDQDLSVSLDVDVGELINLGICYFGKRKEPNGRRPLLSSALSFSFRRAVGNNAGTDFSSRAVGRIPSPARGIQVESARVLRVRRLVVDISPLRPLHSLEFPAGRVDRMERSHLVS